MLSRCGQRADEIVESSKLGDEFMQKAKSRNYIFSMSTVKSLLLDRSCITPKTTIEVLNKARGSQEQSFFIHNNYFQGGNGRKRVEHRRTNSGSFFTNCDEVCGGIAWRIEFWFSANEKLLDCKMMDFAAMR